MERVRLLQDGDPSVQDGFWNLRWPDATSETNLPGPAAWEQFLSRLDANQREPQTRMSVAEFVRNAFVPEHVEAKGPSGQTHFQAILKHVLTPEEVDRMFRKEPQKFPTKLKALPDWPYLDDVRLCDAQPEDVQRLIEAALARGYSTQTVVHIRNVVSVIFAHARKKGWFYRENPASMVTLPQMIRKEAHTLTLTQAKDVLGAMRYPEKEITLTAILTQMNVTEICGLQWKRVNLTADWMETDGEAIAPRTISVRMQWHRSGLYPVGRKKRVRDVAIPAPLLPVLVELKRREKYTEPEDFVLASRIGTPIDQKNLSAQRLKRLGERLGMPWLSWHVLSRTRASMAYELGMHFLGLV